MTYEKKRELAEWIAKHNQGAISGSIMLKERNVPIHREPKDIDIVVSSYFKMEEAILPPFIHDIQYKGDDNGYPVLVRCWYEDIKIEFFKDDEAIYNAEQISSNVPYCQISDLQKAKEYYLKNDTDKGYLDKTLKDLSIIYDYQKQFPIIRYTVSCVGIMQKLVADAAIHGKYIFKMYNMMDCDITEDWKIKPDDYLPTSEKTLKQVLSLDNRDLIKDIETAKSLSKERWDKNMNPNGKYIVVRYFDDMFDGNVIAEPVSKKDALKILKYCNSKKESLYSYDIKLID